MMKLRMGGMGALQTGTPKAPARATGGKAPQIEKYPEIQDLADKIMPAGRPCKQDIHRADGLKLVDLMNRFAKIYWATKDIKTVRKPAYPPNITVVYPIH